MKKFPDEGQIIIEVTLDFLKQTGLSKTDFACKMLAPNIGEIEPLHNTDANERWQNAQLQRVSRFLSKGRPFPIELKWPWVFSLPEQYQEECMKRLFSCVGRTMPLPDFSGADGVNSNVPEIFKASACVTENLAPAYDGVYDDNDDMDASNKLIDSLIDSALVQVAEAKRVRSGTGATGYKYNIDGFDFEACGQSSNENT